MSAMETVFYIASRIHYAGEVITVKLRMPRSNVRSQLATRVNEPGDKKLPPTIKEMGGSDIRISDLFRVTNTWSI